MALGITIKTDQIVQLVYTNVLKSSEQFNDKHTFRSMTRKVNEKIPSLIDVFICSSSTDEDANLECLKDMKIRTMNELQAKKFRVYVDYAQNIESQGYVNEFLQENNVRFVLKLVIDNKQLSPNKSKQ